MLLIPIGWHSHLTVDTLDRLRSTAFLMFFHLLPSNLLPAVLALLEVMVILSMLIGIVDVVRAIAIGAALYVATAVAEMEIEFLFGKGFLTVVAELHLFVYFWNLIYSQKI